MAFELRGLSVLAYANGFTFWHYKARADEAQDVCAEHFFDDAGDMLSPGDMILVSAKDGARMLFAGKRGHNVVTATMAEAPGA